MNEEIKQSEEINLVERFEVDVIKGESKPYAVEGNPFDDLIRVKHVKRFGSSCEYLVSARVLLRHISEQGIYKVLSHHVDRKALRENQEGWFSKDIFVDIEKTNNNYGGYDLRFYNEDGHILTDNLALVLEDFQKALPMGDGGI